MKPAREPLRLEWRTPEELADNPAKWSKATPQLMSGLDAVMEELERLDDGTTSGAWAGVELYNLRTERLIDGHKRKTLDPRRFVDGALVGRPGKRVLPTLVGSWTEEQERVILATLDPLAAMAEADGEALASLVGSIETEDDRVAELLSAIVAEVLPVEPEPPAEFPVVDETIQTEHQCPKCGYRWSGSTAPTEP